MDVDYFLKKRTAFIRQFYNIASAPFLELKRKIEAEEPPFTPPYSEDGEPPFLEEWIEADESIQVIGYSCISMLAASLHLYFREWENQFRTPASDSVKPEFKKGWLNGYKVFFATNFDIKFECSGADLSLLEEVVLIRNRIQHPESITSQRENYLPSDIKKLTRAFFVDDLERNFLNDMDKVERSWLSPVYIDVTGDKLIEAIMEVEKFSEWLQAQIVQER